MTQKEFLAVVSFKIPELAKLCGSLGWNGVMRFKREFQQALAAYARHHKMDRVQEKSLAIITKIEKWARMAFVEKEIIKIRAGKPYVSFQAAKNEARGAWEHYNRRESY